MRKSDISIKFAIFNVTFKKYRKINSEVGQQNGNRISGFKY